MWTSLAHGASLAIRVTLLYIAPFLITRVTYVQDVIAVVASGQY